LFNVLIVEDDRKFSAGFCAVLQAHFPLLALICATCVQEALAVVDSIRPDLIFTRIRLPDGSGLDFTRHIRQAGVKSTVVVLTGHHHREYRDAAFNSGADHFMPKSSTQINDIFGIVESILATRLGSCG
jgi:two-component system response regulator YesN